MEVDKFISSSVSYFLRDEITEGEIIDYFEKVEIAPKCYMDFYKTIFRKLIPRVSFKVLEIFQNTSKYYDRMGIKELIDHAYMSFFFENCTITNEEICKHNKRLMRVKLTYNDITKEFLALINDFTVEKKFDFERYFSEFCPGFYVGCTSRAENQYLRKYVFFSLDYVISIDESVLNPHLCNFHKLSTSERKSSLTIKQYQAQDLYRSIVPQLKRCNEIFTRNYIKVYPKSILVYKNQNAPGLLGFVLIPYRFSYKKFDEDESQSIFLNNEENKRFSPPELAYKEYYRVRFPAIGNKFDVGASEIWSASACTLNFITDKNVDKWNNINFESTLFRTINNCITHLEFSKLKNELLKNLSLDYRERRNLNEAINSLP